ncbi:Hsp70 family protein [Bradyrhizobium sp. 26S5]|uniref:AMP-binding enzyme n=1 Tax=Bradyrhizobium sp. 26S5 TaxID=3139729 RepID=UPI0030D30238
MRDTDGHYHFADRMKDSIRRRGENVSSWEVEQVLLRHPAIAACAIYPLPSELGEDEVAAAVQLRPGHALEAIDVVTHCEGQIAYFAIPRFVRIVTEMPLTENGKIRKVVLREAGMTADTWDRNAAGYIPAAKICAGPQAQLSPVTCADREGNQNAVTIRVFQGEREMAADSKFLGQFDLVGIAQGAIAVDFGRNPKGANVENFQGM